MQCCVEVYKNEAGTFFENNAPVTTKTVKVKDSNNLWYNFEIKNSKKAMRKAEKKYLRQNNDYNRNEFRRLRQLKCDTVKKVKSSYYNEKIKQCEDDPRKLYSNLNKLLGRKNADEKLPLASDDFTLANDFKNFFINKISALNGSFPRVTTSHENLKPDYPVRKFEQFQKVSDSEVLHIMRRINKCSFTNDPFDIKLLDFGAIEIPLAACISKLVEASFEEGIFPDSEKCAIVRPKLKSGKDSEVLESYRPLYNTSFLSKVLESAAKIQLLDHISKFECLSKYQSAYRASHSVETALCRLNNDLILRRCRGETTLLVQLDLTAAFDTVDIAILLNDLQSIGVGGSVLSWFASYLEHRRFKVLTTKKVSDV